MTTNMKGGYIAPGEDPETRPLGETHKRRWSVIVLIALGVLVIMLVLGSYLIDTTEAQTEAEVESELAAGNVRGSGRGSIRGSQTGSGLGAGTGTAKGTGTSTGTGTRTGTGKATATATGAGTGTGSSKATGTATSTGTGESTGAGTGESTGAGTGESTGAGTGESTGAETATGASTGTGSASAQSKAEDRLKVEVDDSAPQFTVVSLGNIGKGAKRIEKMNSLYRNATRVFPNVAFYARSDAAGAEYDTFTTTSEVLSKIDTPYVLFLGSMVRMFKPRPIKALIETLESGELDIVSASAFRKNSDGKLEYHRRCFEYSKPDKQWDLTLTRVAEGTVPGEKKDEVIACDITHPFFMMKKETAVDLAKEEYVFDDVDARTGSLSMFITAKEAGLNLGVRRGVSFYSDSPRVWAQFPFSGKEGDKWYRESDHGEQDDGPVHVELRKIAKKWDFRRIVRVDGHILLTGCTEHTGRCDVSVFHAAGYDTPPCCQQRLREIIAFIARFFPNEDDNHNIEFWADYSSALSVLRDEGKIIPWDYDGDIGIYYKGWKYMTSEEFRDKVDDEGFYLQPQDGGGFARIFRSFWNGVYVDLYKMSDKQKDSKTFIANASSGSKAKEDVPKDWVFPLQLCTYGESTNFKCVKELEKLVVNRYGEGWETPVRDNTQDPNVYNTITPSPRGMNPSGYDAWKRHRESRGLPVNPPPERQE